MGKKPLQEGDAVEDAGTAGSRRGAAAAAGVTGAQGIQTALRKRTLLILSASGLLLLAHAFIPLDRFILRSDDAYYYFKVAANYPRLGFWSFDGIHPTNGVQPLWAGVLTAVAQVMHWAGIRDSDILARVFVAVTALLHFASCLVLFHLLSRKISTGTAVAAAGAFLFPMGIVWARVWGMENSLYALLLLSAISYFHLVHLEKATIKTSIVLGILLGLTTLSRLNAGFLIVCLLGYWVLGTGKSPFGERFRLAVVIGASASLLIVPYLLWNYHATNHILPISGAVKSIVTANFLSDNGLDSPFRPWFVKVLYDQYLPSVRWFLSSRAGDGLWIVGGRMWFSGESEIPAAALASMLAALLLLPVMLGQPMRWIRFLGDRLRRLSPFTYVAVFGALDALVSVMLYPTQLGYAMIRWWLVENEIVIIVLISTIAAATLSHVSARLVPARLQLGAATAALAIMVAFHAQQTVRHYWGPTAQYDWNKSWNDESYKAARWLRDNAAADEKVGSWNAGVLGYYSEQPVVNLDGLINNFDLLPYLREKRVSDYVKKEGIRYLSDMESIFRKYRIIGNLKLTEVYSHYSIFMRQYYRIYRVDE